MKQIHRVRLVIFREGKQIYEESHFYDDRELAIWQTVCDLKNLFDTPEGFAKAIAKLIEFGFHNKFCYGKKLEIRIEPESVQETHIKRKEIGVRIEKNLRNEEVE